jgi:hypothetical protein
MLKGDNETNGSTPPYYGFSAEWNGGMLEIGDYQKNSANTTTCAAFRVKDAAFLQVNNAYVENYGTYCDNSFHYWVSHNGRVNLRGVMPSNLAAWYNKYEDNATICQDVGPDNGGASAGIYRFESRTPYCIGRDWDKVTWGPPTFPTGGSNGRHGYPGQEMVDVYGTRWRQVQKTQASGYDTFAYGNELHDNARWGPAPGTNRIVIPVNAATLNAGNSMLYWNQADMLLKDLHFVVDEAFTCSGGSFSIGNSCRRYFYITATQAAAANLTAGATISSHDNDNATHSALGWSFVTTTTSVHEADNKTITSTSATTGTHRALFMPGYSTADMTGAWESTLLNSYIGIYPSCGSSWTTGSGWVVMTVEPLEY